jgi:hypothetical protein
MEEIYHPFGEGVLQLFFCSDDSKKTLFLIDGFFTDAVITED